MIKKEILDLNSEDSKKIQERINNEFINIVRGLTDKEYIQECKFVLFNVVSKDRGFLELTSERTSIGYMLPNNTIYDFIANRFYEIYELHNEGNKEKMGEFALINNIIFKNSRKKISLTKNNLNEITNLFDKYIQKYKNCRSAIREEIKELNNLEYIPEFSRKFTIF